MSNANEYNANEFIDDFKANYDKFVIACDALEEEGKWPLDELGEMDVYFKNDFACVIIKLITADGKIDVNELNFLNDALGFDYKIEELRELYKNDGDRIDSYFETELGKSIAMIREKNEKLADMYKTLFMLIGKIVIQSDGVVTYKEKAAAEAMVKTLG